MFEGVAGNGVRGDIAFDDVSLTLGACWPTERDSHNCTFEHPLLCGWHQVMTISNSSSSKQLHRQDSFLIHNKAKIE